MNWVSGTEFLRIVMWFFAAFLIPLCLLFGFAGILYSFCISILVAPILMFITSKLANSAERLYRGSATASSEKDILLMELDKIKILLGRREYSSALKLINAFVRSNPGIPEAYYLKAHILWDGFRDRERAMLSLRRVLSCSEPGNDYYKWAMNFKEELKAHEADAQKRKTKQPSDK